MATVGGPRTEHDRTEHDRTEHDRTEHNRTEHNRTKHNLAAAFLRESAAHASCLWAAKRARKDGLIQAARAFEETAEQKLALAKRFQKRFETDAATLPVSLPFAPRAEGETVAALRSAADDEAASQRLFLEFSATAREEGMADLEILFRLVANAQALHERRFRALAERFSSAAPFERDEPIAWYCIKCGYVHEGTKAPSRCPACAHPQGWFEPLADNW